MVKTLSNMLPLGTTAPDFNLPNIITGQNTTLKDEQGEKATVIMFICNHCPYVKHISSEIARLARDYQKQGVAFIAINANDAEQYPDDAPAQMITTAQKEGYDFPYLFDATQEVARAYQAACTPDFYLYDNRLKLVYRGQLDDARPGNGAAVSGQDLRHAIACVLEEKTIDIEQKPSMGCNIKWKD